MALSARQSSNKISEGLVGKTVEIIAETSSDGIVDGLTKNYVRVYVPDSGIELGAVIKVKVERLHKDGVIGAAIVQ